MSKLWNIKQVREYLGVSRATVYRLIKRGLLPKPAKVGGSARWLVDDVMAVVKNGAQVSRE